MRKVMLTAHRFTAPEALAAGIVDEVIDGDGESVVKRALELAESMKKHSASGCLQMMKQIIYADIVDSLARDENLSSPSDLNEARFKALKAAKARESKL